MLGRLVGFCDVLRAEGVVISTSQALVYCAGAARLPPEDLYHVGMATLINRGADGEVYRRVFKRYWSDDERRARAMTVPPVAPLPIPDGAPLQGEQGTDGEDADVLVASFAENLRQKSFALMSDEELERVARLMRTLALSPPLRRTRRRQPARRGQLDWRATMRRSVRTGGEPVRRQSYGRRSVPRRVLLFLDVSKSMSAYSRGLLCFAHAVLKGQPRWEVFCFSTRLTRLTPALRAGPVNAALEQAAKDAHGWDGGTRIGDSLHSFLIEHGQGSLARGAVVLICSDGLDVGEPEVLGAALERLHRLAHSVTWLNPMKETRGYEPTAGGMRAALRHVDMFASGHSLASLAEIIDKIASSHADRRGREKEGIGLDRDSQLRR
ncbi:vWA domain-containing protein [Pseudonocardia sp. H11422]|uniref:vWA domain-containing protein n=1 Tax=Pseudonocardia sp. H11422 TaxID=2835866 RepID=UPI0020296F4C|nr:VWA domain-containing protein [Pseudonocardia sp. H11422]